MNDRLKRLEESYNDIEKDLQDTKTLLNFYEEMRSIFSKKKYSKRQKAKIVKEYISKHFSDSEEMEIEWDLNLEWDIEPINFELEINW